MLSSLEKKALLYLENDFLSHIDMIEPIRRKTADILYAGDDGVVLLETESSTLMASMPFGNKLRRLMEPEKHSLFAVHQEETADWLLSGGRLSGRMDTWQYAYLKGRPIPGDFSCIRPLTPDFSDVVAENYGEHDRRYIELLIRKGRMFGLFENGSLAGFIGEHSEGSVGLLEILPEYRRKGYGLMLESYMINRSLSRGETPFGQVITNNGKSKALQEKLGMEKSARKTFWIWEEN